MGLVLHMSRLLSKSVGDGGPSLSFQDHRLLVFIEMEIPRSMNIAWRTILTSIIFGLIEHVADRHS